MNLKLPRVQLLLATLLATACLLIVLLLKRETALSREYSQLRMRLRLPYPGLLVPTVRLATTGHDSITIGELRDSTAKQVLFVFTTTCPYCKATLPLWARIADSVVRLPRQPVQVIGLSLDPAEQSATYARTHAFDFPVGVIPSGKIRQLLRTVAVPQTIVLNHEGRVQFARTGLLQPEIVLDSLFRAVAWQQKPRPPVPVGAAPRP